MSRDNSKPRQIAKANPGSSVSESYKKLRTNIRFSSMGQAVKVILVSSAVTGEGRTTTAINLAISYAQENKNVLLLDADLRRPSVGQAFFRSSRTGLSDILIRQSMPQDTIQQTDIAGLFVLPAGTVPPNPSELLGSEAMRELLEELKEQFDVIVVDSPPASSFADAQIVGAMSDGVVLVARSGKVTKEAVRRTRLGLEHVGAHILGAVLNNTSRGIVESNYANYYGYGGDHT
ncbi:CpsD/CapB family tyrosine-protein kinase [Cohnella sp. JJ-181]|uniref:CpsD/CapB family tyrosine-protein kinase n=1 Tax=Cohnella rhizoplanae TaxID=2974897 RepID=UPI0022FF621B|nr:CpsD/CapB family tyrosine-protein kinase [Cohnella sp. JJ-181]CAI6076838.1 Tyrosine-protein kinase YwqD [Cohnella sp. JJ-181]